MKTELVIIGIFIIFVMMIFLMFLVPVPLHRDVPMVCSTVEFNPDMTTEIRKKCRELRATKN